MRLSELIAGAPGVEHVRGNADRVRVCDLTEDSRTAVPGSLFVARPGLAADGRRFAHEAVDAGAVCVLTDDPSALDVPESIAVIAAADVRLAEARLAERFFGNPSSKLRVIGVTGTNGKTTVVSIIHRLLNAAGVRTGMIGTVEIDDGSGVAPAEMTTPPAIELSRTMSVMVEHGCRAVCMEASSHALDQKRCDGLAFDTAVFTNLTGDHLDYHGTQENYLAAKRRLFEMLDAAPGDGVAILNALDAASDDMKAAAQGSRAIWCAPAGHRDNDWSVHAESWTLDGTSLRIDGVLNDQAIEIAGRTALIGRHNVMNTAQAVIAAGETLTASGIEPKEAAARLSRGLTLVGPATGRMEPVHGPDDDVSVFIDFAHTDDALDKSLSSVRALVPEGRSLWVVFGAGGHKDQSKRPRMGAAAAAHADRVIVTSDNPRGESPSVIISAILSGISADERKKADVQADRAVAIAVAVRDAASGDVVVIAGKGHERVQVLPDGRGGVSHRPFDDREHAKAALQIRRTSGAIV